jgi:hypothetical protein
MFNVLSLLGVHDGLVTTATVQRGSVLIDSLVGIGAALAFVTFGLPGYALVFNAIAIANVKSQLSYFSTLYSASSLSNNQITLPSAGTTWFSSLPTNISVCDWSDVGCSTSDFSSQNGTSPDYALLDSFAHADYGATGTMLLSGMDTYSGNADTPDSGTSCGSGCSKLVYSSVKLIWYGK